MGDGHQWIASIYAGAGNWPPDRFACGLAEDLIQYLGIRAMRWVCHGADAEQGGQTVLVNQWPGRWPDEGVINRTVQSPADRQIHEFRLLQNGHPCTASRELDGLLLHVANAWSICNRYASLSSTPAQLEQDVGQATVSGDGRIVAATESFVNWVAPRLDGEGGLDALPFSIRWSPRVAAGGIVWRGLHFQVSRVEDGYELAVRPAREEMPAITEREWAVVRELCAGKTYRQIGETLHMAPTTASSHTYKLMEKLGLRRKHELIQWCQRQAVHLA
ncbi:MAG: helix-turn-helix transcriptional regulator [Abyssibacter sp.]|uniref:helix-turn-helix transcriptional regulator n=1 Tax=Abyssibacter sp. TaxID=2320200 RepID=UPI00321A2F64